MNVLQRVGGAIGTAVLAVVLQRASAGAQHARPSWPAPSAPPTGGRWGSARCSLIPCVVLLRAEGPKTPRPRADRGGGDRRGGAGAARCLRAASRRRRRRPARARSALTELGQRLPPRLPQPAQPARPRHPPARRRDRPRPVRAAGRALRARPAARRRAGRGGRRPERRDRLRRCSTTSATDGHVERVRSETDRRVVVIKLTRRGRRRVEATQGALAASAGRRRWRASTTRNCGSPAGVLERIGAVFEDPPRD